MVLDADWDIDLEDSWNYKWNSKYLLFEERLL
jgi:hypothetical protein